MEGRTVSHYLVLDQLGGGGMGVVYRAQDTRLKRIVALKFLPPELTRDEEAKQRFLHEAEAASALEHTNICTVHEIDETPEGQIFLVMAYYNGETLKKRIASGPLELEDALDIASQIAYGLARAHDAGIVHRDIKPANLMITDDGVVKLVDFGIAKLEGQTQLTRTGSRVGTVAYMSPEQIAGDKADQRCDIWALGVVLREMLTGEPTFSGEHELSLINAIVNEEPKQLHDVRSDTPRQLERIVARAMAKNPDARYNSAAELYDDLVECRAAVTAPATNINLAASLWRLLQRPRVAFASVLALVLMGSAAGWAWNRGSAARWAREEAIPEIRQLAELGSYVAAFDLAKQVEQVIPDDPELVELWPEISADASFESVPTNAEIRVKEYADVDGEWQSLGRTPLGPVRLPLGATRVQARLAGYETAETLGESGSLFGFNQQFVLREADNPRLEMVAVPGAPLDLGFVVLRGAFEPLAAPGYLIDRHEVTNEEFQAFVNGGGYQANEYWTEAFELDGRNVSWDVAIGRFEDATGRAGPSTWAVGTFPGGQAEYPVSGVSWYEAAAYCKFAGKTLPTIYHWGHAATMYWSAFIAPLGNFGRDGPMAVGASASLSRSGAYDMAGNVKEWVWNASGGERYIVGGAWSDPTYKFYEPEARQPFDRSEANGFRCAVYEEPIPSELAQDIPLPRRDYSQEQPVSDELFEAYRDRYRYDPSDLNAIVEQSDEQERWRRDKITFDAAYGARMTAYLFLPKDRVPPYQTVVHWPGAFGFAVPSSENFYSRLPAVLEALPIGGRALMVPIYDGTFERDRGEVETGYSTEERVYRDYAVRWVQDSMRSVDYLATREDIDADKLAYLGTSWGGQYGSVVAAVEPRLKTAVLALSGLPMQRSLPEIDPINFAGHVTMPVLMLGGEFDYVFPVESSQRPLYDLLGTPATAKRHVELKGVGHALPANETIREILLWLDTYLGPVN